MCNSSAVAPLTQFRTMLNRAPCTCCSIGGCVQRTSLSSVPSQAKHMLYMQMVLPGRVAAHPMLCDWCCPCQEHDDAILLCAQDCMTADRDAITVCRFQPLHGSLPQLQLSSGSAFSMIHICNRSTTLGSARKVQKNAFLASIKPHSIQCTVALQTARKNQRTSSILSSTFRHQACSGQASQQEA